MARDRERHVNTGRRGRTPAAPNDMPSGTGKKHPIANRFTSTAGAQPDRPGGPQQHRQRSLEARIENALRIVAELLEDNEAYLPIFLRLEAERDKLKLRHAALDRARALLKETPPRSQSGRAPRP
ncbi:hypothetical protein [Marivita cryptomonadis]|uniref:hypothetical protein n=1 Tax=Marivita cryptomonadis TaxID=505252 RepID=UPI00111BDB17|nr:hypothetical protein [Marivita cryptomonadis]